MSRSSAGALSGARRAIVFGASLLAYGCALDSVIPVPETDVSRQYWSLTLDRHAINLATVTPFDTVRVVATPRRPDGSPLADVAAPTFRSSDPTRVQVDSQGLVRAVRDAGSAFIIASLRVGNILHADTAFVRTTTDSVPVIPAALSIQPLPGDSATWEANLIAPWALFGSKVIVAHDGEGNALDAVAVHFASSDTTIAKIDRSTGTLDGVRPGVVTLRASTTAWGRVLSDSLRFTVTMPLLQMVIGWPPSTGATTVIFEPGSVTIAAGGTIVFFNGNRAQMAITFDDSLQVAEDQLMCWCGAGNIAPFGNDTVTFDNARARSFPVAGTYVYRTTLNGGATGKVIVAPKPTGTTTTMAPAAMTAPSAPTRAAMARLVGEHLRPAFAAGHR